MGVMTALALGGLALSAGTQIYGEVKKGEARDEARRMQDEEKKRQDKMLADQKSASSAKEKRENEMASNRAQQQAQRSRQQALQSQKKGRRGTLLTGPSGLQGQGVSAGKTLLGN